MASEKARISPAARSAAAFWAATLPPRRQVEDEVGAGGAGALDGGVGGAVGGDDQLEPLARVVEGEGVGDLGGDHLLLVIGGDDQGDAGGGSLRRSRRLPASASGDLPPAQARPAPAATSG